MIGLTIHKKSSKLLLLARKEYRLWFYLADDFRVFLELQNRLPSRIGLRNMGGAANAHYEEVKEELAAAISAMGKRVSEEAWWSGQIASRSTTATPIATTVTALLYAKEVIEKNKDHILVIC